MKRYLRHPVVQNALALYTVQFAQYVRADDYGSVSGSGAATGRVGNGGICAKFRGLDEFGPRIRLRFLSHARDCQTSRRSRSPRGGNRGVVGANILLLAPSILIAVVARFTVPAFQEHQWYLWLALAIAVPQGIRPFWYFQGVERMKFPAWLNVFGRVCVAVGIFQFVKTPEHAWMVLAMPGRGLAPL